MSYIERRRLNGRYICQECGIQCLSKSTFYRHTKQHLLNEEDKQEGQEVEHLDSSLSDADCPNIFDGSFVQDNLHDETGDCSGEVDVSEAAAGGDDDNEEEGEDGNEDDDDDDDDDIPETWDSILEEEVDEDLGILVHRRSGLKSLNDLIFWLLYFILYWQSACHVSDNGIEWLLRFLFQFFNVLSLKVNHALLTEFIMIFPTSMYMLRKLMNLDRDNFERFVVCRECFNTYRLDDCFTEINGVRKTKLCTHEYFKRGRGYKCNTPLLKEVLLKDGSMKLYPYKVYCFNSLINGLEHILQKDNFPELMCHWKDWSYDNNTFRDIYDGQVWKSFGDFFKGDRNLGLILNVDWFQPFRNRTDYSVGVIYFAILNLPRNIRYKFENVIVVGLIPALKKEPNDLFPFLTPVVKELKALWKGVSLKTSLSSISLTIRAALVCVACDIPAARKVCGFKSHSAVLGCHRCFKNFPAASFGAKRDYSGFDRQNWKLRSKQLHNRYAQRVHNAKNKTEFNTLSRKFGTYFSVLIELEYFDAVKFCIVDPMHNLFLGTSKSMFKLWLKKGILDEGKLELIEERLKSMNVVTDIGRIPHKISSNYGGFSAVEWKNWTIVFSLYCLFGILPEKDFKVWEKFVLACKVLCNPFLTVDDVIKADQLLLNFCKSFEQVYSWECVKPNMHLHCHLKECLLDYGPIHVYWCFSFERFNGKFGHFKTNNRCVEIQFMRHIVSAKHCEKLAAIGSDSDLCSFFKSYFEDLTCKTINTEDIVNFLNFSKALNFDLSGSDVTNNVRAPDSYKVASLDVEDMAFLLNCYRQMYPSKTIEMSNLSEIIRKFGHIFLIGERFGSKMDCRTLRSANVLANWNGDGNISIQPDSFGLKPCKIDFYFSHILDVDGISTRHFFAKASWYKEYVERTKYGNNMQLWHFKKFSIAHESSFVPVQRIRCRFTYGLTGQSKDLMVVSAIPRKVYSDNMTD